MGHLKNSQHIKLSEHRLEEILIFFFFLQKDDFRQKKIRLKKK